MKTLIVLLLCAGPCFANAYFDEQERLSEIRRASQQQSEDTQRAIAQAAQVQAQATINAAKINADAMNRQTQETQFGYALTQMSGDQIVAFAEMIRNDQRRIDGLAWAPLEDSDKKPLFLQSPDGKYTIGPVYVKAGTQWVAK